ncbi:MAG TPA: cupredoxin domain-containing protein [Nitrososphaerales archaeon]|nr:cupredoxin domain-containing protein [Nitrososphaerales archaeon]
MKLRETPLVLAIMAGAFCAVVLSSGAQLAPAYAQSPQTVRVSIVAGAATLGSNAYSPDNITVVIGVNNTISWVNNDVVDHTATGSGFDTGIIAPGSSASHTFTSPGTYNYHCSIHPTMVGTVIVVGAAAATSSSSETGSNSPTGTTSGTTSGGVPEFPYQQLATVLLITALVVSYVAARGRVSRTK